MEEVLTRRFLHGKKELEELKEQGKDTALGSFTKFPDILMMDGGKDRSMLHFVCWIIWDLIFQYVEWSKMMIIEREACIITTRKSYLRQTAKHFYL